MPARTPRERRRTYQKHGFYALRSAIAKYNAKGLPLTLERAMRERRQALVDACGGAEAVSPQRLVLIEKVVVQEVLCHSLDAYVLGMDSPVNKRARSLFPVVRERAAQVALLQSLLRDLGLERRAKQVPDLEAYLAERGKKAEPAQPAGGGGGDETAPEMRHNASESR